MSSWFRLYTDILSSRKVQTLEPELFKAWINLLALAKEGDGLLPSYDDIAFQLRISKAEAHRLTEVLVERGLFESTDEGITPHNWDSRQFISDDDPTAALRARRYRAGKQEITDASRVTSRTSHAARAETDSDSEPDSEQSRAEASPAKPRSARRTVCDEDFFAELQANPAYAALDVRQVYHKMVAWCHVKHKQPTRGRLLNWLSREDQPMTANSKPPSNTYIGANRPGPTALLAEVAAVSAGYKNADEFMDEHIDGLIARNDFVQLANEYEAIVERGGAKAEWEIRCVAWYELHKNEPASIEALAKQ